MILQVIGYMFFAGVWLAILYQFYQLIKNHNRRKHG